MWQPTRLRAFYFGCKAQQRSLFASAHTTCTFPHVTICHQISLVPCPYEAIMKEAECKRSAALHPNHDSHILLLFSSQSLVNCSVGVDFGYKSLCSTCELFGRCRHRLQVFLFYPCSQNRAREISFLAKIQTGRSGNTEQLVHPMIPPITPVV